MPTTLETWSNNRLTPAQYPEDARWTAGRFAVSQTIAAGTLLGKVTSGGLLKAYNDANSDGTQTAVGICMYDIVTDSSGNVFLGTSGTASSLNQPLGKTAPYFVTGTFDTADLTGYDAAGLADLNGKVLANGFIKIG